MILYSLVFILIPINKTVNLCISLSWLIIWFNLEETPFKRNDDSKYSEATKTGTKLLTESKHKSSRYQTLQSSSKKKKVARTPNRSSVKSRGSKRSKSRAKSTSRTSKFKHKVTPSDAKLLK